jgi:hypothetical protein
MKPEAPERIWLELPKCAAYTRPTPGCVEYVRVDLATHAAPKSRASKQKIEDQLRASDVTALETGRQDIVYGPHDSLPQCGEHVARLRKSVNK